MKRLVTAIVLLILIICISCYSLYALENGISDLTQATEELRYHTPEERLEAESKALFDLWNEKEETFVIFVRHDTLDEMTELMAELPSLARYEEYGSFYARVDTILARLDDLARNAKPTYRNLM